MPQAAHDLHEEYWSPPTGSSTPRVVPGPTPKPLASVCPECSTEFVVGARFCHVCGNPRTRSLRDKASRLAGWLSVQRLQETLGLSLAPLIGFVTGTVCVLSAIATGLMYSTTTMTDWQAVQVWRIQWLLAAAAAFLAGLLLKRSAD